MAKKSTSLFNNRKIAFVLFGFIILLAFNQFYSIKVAKKDKTSKSQTLGLNVDFENLSAEELAAAEAFIKFKKIKTEFIPSGIPDIYGQELDISFDKVQEAINKVRVYGPTYGEEGEKITLEGDDLERYKKIGVSIACEYCCGVKTLTKEDGTAACGCAHSIMMRGLAAYLIKNYPNELNNEQILEELEKWKITYFPKQTLSSELEEMKKEGDSSIETILKEFPDFLPQMVGGC